MKQADWEAAASGLALRQSKADGCDFYAARRHLVEWDHLFSRAPHQVETRFKDIPEDTLRGIATEARNCLDAGTPLPNVAGDIVQLAAGRVRALDRFLLETSPIRGAPDDPASDFLCATTGVHVIPRRDALPPRTARIGSKTYRRRGIVWHRLVPATTREGYEIDLHWDRDLSLSFRRPGAMVVCAQFADLELLGTDNRPKFVAASAHCVDEEETLRAHVQAANAEGVVLSAWPELTMPPQRRRLLADLLREQTEKSPLREGPSVMVAGSWHEVIDGGVRNRMHVLSGAGRECFHHDKSLPLESNSLGTEELEPGWRIPILITKDALVAFAICRDFCEGQLASAYVDLDVDLVVVPSYGDRKTIEAHRQQATELARRGGARSFVVQQVGEDGPDAPRFGYALPPSGDPPAATAALATDQPCSTFPLSFKTV